jgi:hypothetical protein
MSILRSSYKFVFVVEGVLTIQENPDGSIIIDPWTLVVNDDKINIGSATFSPKIDAIYPVSFNLFVEPNKTYVLTQHVVNHKPVEPSDVYLTSWLPERPSYVRILYGLRWPDGKTDMNVTIKEI